VTGGLGLLSGRRILVVEDEYFIADEVASELRAAGAQVVGPYPSVDRAYRGLASQPGAIDAAVLDVNLAGLSSAELIRRLRDETIPVLLATGYDAASLEVDLKALPRVEKPCSTIVLLERLASLLH